MRRSISGAALLSLTLGLLGSRMMVRAQDAAPEKRAPHRQEVSERIRDLRNDLDLELKNQQITSDQYNAEVSKLNQLKIQERVDLKQNDGDLTDAQKEMYHDALDQIEKEIEDMTPPPPASTAPAVPESGAPANP